MARSTIDMSRVKLNQLINDLHGSDIGRLMVHSSDKIFVPRMREMMRKNGSVWRSTLIKSVSTRTVAYETNQYGAAVEVGTIGVQYGLDVDRGREPHTPSRQKIRKWVAEKLRPTSVRRVTSLVIRAIERRGVRARPFLKPTYARNRLAFVADLRRRIQRHLRS